MPKIKYRGLRGCGSKSTEVFCHSSICCAHCKCDAAAYTCTHTYNLVIMPLESQTRPYICATLWGNPSYLNSTFTLFPFVLSGTHTKFTLAFNLMTVQIFCFIFFSRLICSMAAFLFLCNTHHQQLGPRACQFTVTGHKIKLTHYFALAIRLFWK